MWYIVNNNDVNNRSIVQRHYTLSQSLTRDFTQLLGFYLYNFSYSIYVIIDFSNCI